MKESLEKPNKFDKKIYKTKLVSPSGFEDSVRDQESVSEHYMGFKEIVESYGIDLKKVKVLEIGSGNAVFLDYMKEQGVNVVGVDANPRGRKESPEVTASIEQLPFADEQFEVIYSEQIFDNSLYNQNQNLMMKEIARVLKRGGIYFSLLEFRLEVEYPKELSLDNKLSNPELKIYKKL